MLFYLIFVTVNAILAVTYLIAFYAHTKVNLTDIKYLGLFTLVFIASSFVGTIVLLVAVLTVIGIVLYNNRGKYPLF